VFRLQRVSFGVILIRLSGLSLSSKAHLVSTALHRHAAEMAQALASSVGRVPAGPCCLEFRLQAGQNSPVILVSSASMKSGAGCAARLSDPRKRGTPNGRTLEPARRRNSEQTSPATLSRLGDIKKAYARAYKRTCTPWRAHRSAQGFLCITVSSFYQKSYEREIPYKVLPLGRDYGIIIAWKFARTS
jgi:hypothetical protein